MSNKIEIKSLGDAIRIDLFGESRQENRRLLRSFVDMILRNPNQDVERLEITTSRVVGCSPDDDEVHV